MVYWKLQLCAIFKKLIFWRTLWITTTSEQRQLLKGPKGGRCTHSNLCKPATLGTLKLWPLLTGGRCSEVAYIIQIEIGPFKWWPLKAVCRLFRGISGLTVYFLFIFKFIDSQFCYLFAFFFGLLLDWSTRHVNIHIMLSLDELITLDPSPRPPPLL